VASLDSITDKVVGCLLTMQSLAQLTISQLDTVQSLTALNYFIQTMQWTWCHTVDVSRLSCTPRTLTAGPYCPH